MFRLAVYVVMTSFAQQPQIVPIQRDVTVVDIKRRYRLYVMHFLPWCAALLAQTMPLDVVSIPARPPSH